MPNEKYRIDRIKIYDYFLIFPNDLRKTTIPNSWNSFKAIKKENRYNQVQNSIDVFNRISGFQNIALNAMASFGLIDGELFCDDFIKKTQIMLDVDLKLTAIEDKYLQFINSYLNKISLKELKERTKLMEHRYELS